jgi:hypothetical protein
MKIIGTQLEAAEGVTCPRCGGTILTPSIGGAKRGTCHCPENLTTEEEMKKTTKDTTPKALEKVEPKAPKPISYSPEGEVRSVKVGTKLAALIDLLAQGATMEQLVEGLSRTGSAVDASGVRSWLSYDLRRAGYGVRQDQNLFYLVFPEGMTEPLAHKVAEPKKVAPVVAIQKGEPQPMKRAAGSAKPKRDRKAERERRALKLAAAK